MTRTRDSGHLLHHHAFADHQPLIGKLGFRFVVLTLRNARINMTILFNCNVVACIFRLICVSNLFHAPATVSRVLNRDNTE